MPKHVPTVHSMRIFVVQHSYHMRGEKKPNDEENFFVLILLPPVILCVQCTHKQIYTRLSVHCSGMLCHRSLWIEVVNVCVHNFIITQQLQNHTRQYIESKQIRKQTEFKPSELVSERSHEHVAPSKNKSEVYAIYGICHTTNTNTNCFCG